MTASVSNDLETMSAMVPNADIMTSTGYFQAVHQGVSGQDLKGFIQTLGQRDLFIRVLGTDSSNLSKFYRKATLATPLSDGVIDTLRVLMLATRVYGTRELADEWLNSAIPALGGEKPIDLIDTHAGRELVRQVLKKIEFGEYS